jgi:hypothetical protein
MAMLGTGAPDVARRALSKSQSRYHNGAGISISSISPTSPDP